MFERLEEVVSDEMFEQVSSRLKSLKEEGILRVRDWMAIYDIMLDACKRNEAELTEELMIGRINSGQ